MSLDGEYRFYGSLDKIQGALGERFLRCHKSFLVNIAQVLKFSGGRIVLQGGMEVPVSRSYVGSVKKRLLLEMR